MLTPLYCFFFSICWRTCTFCCACLLVAMFSAWHSAWRSEAGLQTVRCLWWMTAPSLQVQAFIRGNAVSGAVQQALESLGTPNSLLQTDLTQIPTLAISPDSLSPAVLYEGSFSATSNQTMTIGNVASSSVNYTVSSLPPCHVDCSVTCML